MPEIRITDDQRNRLEALREQLEAEHAGPYGTVRVEDAMEYLLDLAEAADGVDPGAVEQPAESSGDSDGRDGSDLTAVPGVGTATAEALRGAGFPDVPALRAADVDALAAVDGIGVDRAAEIKAEVDTMDVDAGATDGDFGTDASGPDDTNGGDESGDVSSDEADDAASGGDDQLSAMMNLLATHDDKWREAEGEARYEVDLPNGGVATAQTKDDVKAVLFRHY